MEELREEQKEPGLEAYAITRKLYPYESMVEYLCTLLTSSAFFAKLSISLGVSDAMTALIETLASFVCVFQLISGRIARFTPVKPWLIPVTLVTRLSMVVMFLLPFVKVENLTDVFLLLLVLVAQATLTIVSPIKQNVFLSAVEEKERVRYLAGHRAVSLLFGAPIVLFGGLFIDTMENRGMLKEAYLCIALLLSVFTVLHILILCLSKEPPTKVSEHKNIFADFGALVRNKDYRSFLGILLLHHVAMGILAPFLNTYQIREMGLSISVLGIISAISIMCFFLGLVFARRFGHRLHPTIARTVYFIAYIIYDVIWLTMTPENGIVVNIIVCLAAGVINSMHTISYVPLIFQTVREEERTSALALAGATTGVVTFLSVLCVSPFFDMMQKNGVVIFGVSLYAQQVLAVISALVRIGILVLWLSMCRKMKRSD